MSWARPEINNFGGFLDIYNDLTAELPIPLSNVIKPPGA
jgi:hypothetical protein